MAKLSILEFPDPRLKTVAKRVENVTDFHHRLIRDMAETMYAAPGIGLAATQVDVHEQIIVIDVSEEKNQLQVFINPEILEKSSDILRGEEGCLSVPGFFEEVPRSSRVKVRYMDENEVVHILDAEGILAVCLQHETDHLKGKLFVDYLSPLKRSRLLHKIKKQQREAAKNR